MGNLYLIVLFLGPAAAYPTAASNILGCGGQRNNSMQTSPPQHSTAGGAVREAKLRPALRWMRASLETHAKLLGVGSSVCLDYRCLVVKRRKGQHRAPMMKIIPM